MKTRFYLQTAKINFGDPNFDKVIALNKERALFANLEGADFCVDLQNGRKVYLYGDIFYHIKDDGNIKLIDAGSNKYLKGLFSKHRLKDIITHVEGQYIGIYVDEQKQTIHIFSDRYARHDVFYAFENADFYCATDLDFIFGRVKPRYDQKMLAHLLSVYGCYTPKGLTIYSNVKQLKVGEIITITSSGVKSEIIEFKPLKIEDYSDEQLSRYYNMLRDSVIARANRKGKTWISSSSGWDSSVLLGLLVNEFGAENVGMISGSMRYSEGTDVINKFEINKIKKIGAFYGIKPHIVDFDFKSKEASNYWQKILPYYKSRHMYTYITYNFSKLSGKLCEVAGKGQVIFNGETSDSFHNFGFSQFSTFFHTKKSFTEYADKMNCYLYSPSFFKKVVDSTYERDKVFQIFKKMMEGSEFASGWNSREEIVESYLFPFFYGSPRIPFAKTYLNPALTEKGRKAIYNFPFREYMPWVLSDISEKNIYSLLIYLYHSFHSQGSTVNTPKHAMELNNHKWRFPFNDIRLVDLLSKAPEKWGRGLELNNTKYPLKWVAKNKIKFPYDILDEGRHAYLSDVIEGFSLSAEITYRSRVTEFFKESVSMRRYRDILGDDFFDHKYLNKLVDDFLNNKQAHGIDLNNLVSLLTFVVTGWY